ncbi:hypothetical protein C7453_1183 [Gluconacetobacter liquefaciens]|uniref:Uncharacterized protein n=1 Tax=Gluconacetobacter liquefaciens TaxID=89584 RepID=A0A370FVB5_GLULI|nr:hypothetical protein C7453_1183 [Gluconacetobacter liquefaciens]
MSAATMLQSPIESFPSNVDRENSTLVWIFESPSCAIHHPKKRRLYPSHSFSLERRRDKPSISEGGVCDLVIVCLVYTYGQSVKACTYLIGWNVCHFENLTLYVAMSIMRADEYLNIGFRRDDKTEICIRKPIGSNIAYVMCAYARRSAVGINQIDVWFGPKCIPFTQRKSVRCRDRKMSSPNAGCGNYLSNHATKTGHLQTTVMLNTYELVLSDSKPFSSNRIGQSHLARGMNEYDVAAFGVAYLVESSHQDCTHLEPRFRKILYQIVFNHQYVDFIFCSLQFKAPRTIR